MKVVFLAAAGHDYLQDLVYHGLADLLGPQNVVVWPPVDRYHETPPEGVRFPQTYFGFERPARAASLEDELRDADALVIGSLRDGAYELARQALSLPRRPPVAYLDGEDDWYLREVVRDVDVYFKRETLTTRPPSITPLPLQRLYFAMGGEPLLAGPLRRPIAIARAGDPRIRPLPFAMIDPGFRPPRRDRYDVAFMGIPSHRTREAVAPQLRALEAEGLRVFVPSERLPWEEYLQTLADSRACISLRGGGWDTYRYWEIPFVGSLLVSEPLQIHIPNNFVHGEEAFFVPPEKLRETLPQILARDTKAIAAVGERKLRAFHMSQHRARTVLEALGLRP